MTSDTALSLMMSVEALLLAASTLGVTIVRTRRTNEDVEFAKDLAKGCFLLTVLLSSGGVAALFDPLDAGVEYWSGIGGDFTNEKALAGIEIFLSRNDDVYEFVAERADPPDPVDWMGEHGKTAYRALAIVALERYIDSRSNA